MAVVGTAVGSFDNNTRHWQVTLAGVTAGNSSPVFTGKGYQIGAFLITGATAAQFQGSFDGVNFFNVGTAIAASPTAASIAAPDNIVYKFYQLNVTTGTAAGIVDFVSQNAS